MTHRTKAELLTLFADNTSGAIGADDLRDFVDTAHTYKNNEYLFEYHVDQGRAVSDVGADGTFDLPFYTVQAALDKMNADKTAAGIVPTIQTNRMSRIWIYGARVADSTYFLQVHSESLVVTPDYRDVEFTGAIQRAEDRDTSTSATPYGVYWGSAKSGELGSCPEFTHTNMPALIITNSTRASLFTDFIDWCWANSTDSMVDLLPLKTIAELGWDINFSDYMGASYVNEWAGPDMVATIHPAATDANSYVDTSYARMNIACKDLMFMRFAYPRGDSNDTNICGGMAALVLGFRSDVISSGAVGYVSFDGCNTISMLAKNTFQLTPASGTNAINYIDNTYHDASTLLTANNNYGYFRQVSRDYTDKSSGHVTNLNPVYSEIVRLPLHVVAGAVEFLGTNSSGQVNAVRVYNLTADRFIIAGGRQTRSWYNNSRVNINNFLVASTLPNTLNVVTCRVFAKGQVGALFMDSLTVGGRGNSTDTFLAGTGGAKLVGGATTISHMTLTGNLIVDATIRATSLIYSGSSRGPITVSAGAVLTGRNITQSEGVVTLTGAGSTANLTGIIHGSLVVEAGTTLNAVGLTVTGAVSLDPTSTVTWKGGVITGALTDTGSKLGAYVVGDHINI